MTMHRDVHRVLLGIEKKFADLRGKGVYSGFSDRHHCIFIHIPKTAGSAVASSLFGERSRHDPWYVYQMVNARKFASYFKFAFVRNPWDRVVSSFEYLHAGGNDPEDRAWAEKHLAGYPDFATFVRGWLTLQNARTWMHFIPQTDYIFDPADKLMVDFLGRYENLSEDFRDLADRFKPAARLETVNESRHAPFATYYDAETAEIVRRVYARDVELLGYAGSAPGAHSR